MTALTFALKTPPRQRLDLSPLTPDALQGMSERDIAAMSIGTTRQKITVGDAFRITMGAADDIRITGATERLDRIGLGMTSGTIIVEGSVGAYAGCSMSGGILMVKGSAGPWAGSEQSGGRIEITGDAGDYLGAALPGRTAGMRGGVVIVRGTAGERTGDRMRRGLIVIEGAVGRYLGSRMIAGTVVAMGGCGALPGFMMRRGTLILDGNVQEMTPSFADCGLQELVAMRLIGAQVAQYAGARAGQRFSAPVRRFAGDFAALGKGEILRFEA